MQHIDLDAYGLRVLNFESIYTNAYKNITKDLILYDKFTDINVRNQDTKKIYYYHLIKQICDTITSCKTDNRIIVYFSIKDIRFDFIKCNNRRTRKGLKTNTREEFVLFMNRFLKQVKNILPIKVYIGDVKFNTFVQYYNTNKGKYLEIVNTLRTSRARPTNMERFRKFTDKYKLNFLTKHYVDNIKIKCMMYK